VAVVDIVDRTRDLVSHCAAETASSKHVTPPVVKFGEDAVSSNGRVKRGIIGIGDTGELPERSPRW
jgi:hypothetical protein